MAYMTCVDCIHYMACSAKGGLFNEKDITKEMRCLFFKNKADVVEVKRKNQDDESCVICNSELDEAGAGGIWDLAAEICDEVYGKSNYMDEQDMIYNIIREYIEQQEYCPRCGAKMKERI